MRGRIEYNDNVLFSHRYKLDDFIARIRPEVIIKGKTEKTLFSIGSMVIGEKYFDNSQLDTVNTDNHALLQRIWSKRFSTTLDASFSKDETLEEELTAAGQPGLRRTRYRYGFDASGKYVLSDTTSLTIGGGPSFDNYPDGPYPDRDLWQAYLNPAVAVDPKDTLGLFLNYNDADYRHASKVQTVSGSLYWRRDFSKTTYFVLGAGYRHTWTKYSLRYLSFSVDPATGFVTIFPLKEEKSEENGGFIFNAELDNDWSERFSSMVSTGREHYNAIDVRSIDRTYVRMTLKYRLTETISSNCHLSFDTTTEDGPGGRDNNNVMVEPFIAWSLTPNLAINFGGSYRYDKEDIRTDDFGIHRFRGWLSLSYRCPRLLANH